MLQPGFFILHAIAPRVDGCDFPGSRPGRTGGIPFNQKSILAEIEKKVSLQIILGCGRAVDGVGPL
jgi:hypothetical protein